MQQFHEQRGVSSPLPVSPPAAAGSKLAGSSGGRQAADVRVAAGSPPRTAAPAAAKTAAASERSGGGGGCDSAAASPRSREHRHTTEHADAAYTLPEHAQVAALLGQPVYDLSLSAGPGSPAASGSKARRSPFAGELVHHSHPPGPQLTMARSSSHPQAVPASPRAPPAVLAEALAQMPCLSRVSVSSSIGHWLSDDEEEEEERDECLTKQQQQQLEGESGVEPGSGTLRSHSSPSAAVFSSLPFSVRNDPLLRVIPKYCECWCGGRGWLLGCTVDLVLEAGGRCSFQSPAGPVLIATHPSTARSSPRSTASTAPPNRRPPRMPQTACGSMATGASFWSWKTWRGRTAIPASWTSRWEGRGGRVRGVGKVRGQRWLRGAGGTRACRSAGWYGMRTADACGSALPAAAK